MNTNFFTKNSKEESNILSVVERPLVTFALFAYNQAQFIREAIEGALAQTYSPLEIIISDDCSNDFTFDLMLDVTAAYRGPHSIIINRNKENLGIGSHINKIMELSHGELIIGAAGDDVSFPQRTTEMVQAWFDSDKRAFSLDSNYQTISEFGQIIPTIPRKYFPDENQILYFSKTMPSFVDGCTHVWHRDVFRYFGPLPGISMEDVAIPLRSMLLGRVVHVNKTLVKYRLHASNITSSTKWLATDELVRRNIFFIEDRLNVSKDIIRCVRERLYFLTAGSQVAELKQVIENVENIIRQLEEKQKIFTSLPFIRLYHLINYLRLGGFNNADVLVISYAFSSFFYNKIRCMKKNFKKRRGTNF